MRANAASAELWDGPRTGLEAATSLFAVDQTLSIETFGTHLGALIPTFSNVYMDTPAHISPPRRRSLLQSLSAPTLSSVDPALSKVPWSRVHPLHRELHHLRKLKSQAEVAVLRKASDLSGHAHAKVSIAPYHKDKKDLFAHPSFRQCDLHALVYQKEHWPRISNTCVLLKAQNVLHMFQLLLLGAMRW